MADKQILVTGSSDAPEGYTIPNTVEVIPKAVSCVLDGTGASGDFVPVLEVISDGGVVVAQSPGSTVTAGGSVEQSWFPRVAAQAASSTFSGSWIECLDTATTVASGTGYTSYDFTAATTYTNDSSTFTIAAGTGLTINAEGFYVLTAQMDWDISAAPSGVAEMRSGIPNISNAMHGFAPFSDYFSGGTEGNATTTLCFGFAMNASTIGSHGVLYLRQNSGSTATINLQFSVVLVTTDFGNF